MTQFPDRYNRIDRVVFDIEKRRKDFLGKIRERDRKREIKYGDTWVHMADRTVGVIELSAGIIAEGAAISGLGLPLAVLGGAGIIDGMKRLRIRRWDPDYDIGGDGNG